MKKVLIDEKGYEAKTNCEDVFANGDILFAGEDGLIKIIEKENLNNSENPKEKYLEKMLDRDGWLANIEEIKILENGNIVCVETLGSVGIYEKVNGVFGNYKLKIIDSALQDRRIKNDCIYNLKIINTDNVEIWGERGIKYKIKIV